MFLVNVPIVALALLATLGVVTPDRGTRERPLDVPGMLLAAALLGLVTFAFIERAPAAALRACSTSPRPAPAWR